MSRLAAGAVPGMGSVPAANAALPAATLAPGLRGPRRSSFCRALGLAALLALLLCGCSDMAFYWQAARGELEIIHKRRPIDEVLQDPQVDAATKAKLRLVLQAQAFGVRELALPPDSQYHYYADLGRDVVSWVVVATPPLSLEAHRWCYPFVGCLAYRGYFERADAQALAADLQAQGLDVLVRPVRAYSTLGAFDDPVLNTLLRYDEMEIAGTVLHEQAHRRLWVKGDTTFNESYATFVQEEGTQRLLQDPELAIPPADPAQREARFREIQADRALFDALVQHTREQLLALYASAMPDAEKLARKARVFARMRQDFLNQRASFRLLDYRQWFEQPLNNAVLVGVAQYTSRLPAFAALFQEQGRDFARFYQAVQALGDLPPDQRNARLDALAREPGAMAGGVPQ